jgi:simple sugar transport system permease protein
VVLVLSLLAASAGGALWAGVVALLRYWRRVEVVISSLLLTFVGYQVLAYSLSRSFLLREHGTNAATLDESDQLSSKVQLPRLGHYPGFNMGTGLLLAVGVAVLIGLILGRTTLGFRLRLLGQSPLVAMRVGVSAARTGTLALLVSGACAGLAGGVMLTGQAFRVTSTFSNNVGWNGLLVALVARNNAWASIAVALAFGGLQAGGGFLATTGVPTDLVNVVEALVVLAAVVPPALQGIQRRLGSVEPRSRASA